MSADVFRGTWRCFVMQWRVGWVGLAGFVAAVVFPVVATAASMAGLYPEAAQRAVYRATVGASVTSTAFNGRGYGLDELGGIAAFEAGIFTQLVLPILALVLVVRHTRTQEEIGRLDLLTAAPVGRLAPHAAGVLAPAAAALVAGVLTSIGLVVVGMPPAGSVVYGGSLTLLGLVFVGLGALSAQLASTARGALGVGLGVYTLAYATRLTVDARGSELTWLSPLGWTAEVRPFEQVRVSPLAAMVVATGVLVAVGVLLAAGRDLGSAVFRERRGPAAGAVRSVVGLHWRATRGALAGWVGAAVLWGVGLGAVAPDMVAIFSSNTRLAEAMGVEPGHEAAALTLLSSRFLALIGLACGLAVVTRLLAEEPAGRTGLVLAGPRSRTAWLSAVTGCALAQAATVVLLGGAALGVAVRAATGSARELTDALSATAGTLPAAAVVIAVAVLAGQIRPALVVVGWIWFGAIATIALLGDTLRLPTAVRRLSPLEQLGRLPLEDYPLLSGVALTALALVPILFSVMAFRRRDLVAG